MSDTATNNASGSTGIMGHLAQRSDIIMAVGVVLILVILFLPLPPWLLDVALAISFTFSVMVLMTVLFIEPRWNSIPSPQCFC